MKKLLYTAALMSVLCLGCGKNVDPEPVSPAPPAPPVVPPTPKTCIISGISQRNSGSKAEFFLSVVYDNAFNPVKVSVFDSLSNTSLFNATLTYATTDSIRIDQYQYMKLDANKRVSVFVTKSDPADIAFSDDYRYEYSYNTEGYLAAKKLFINGSKTPGYTTTYTYTGELLTGCVMTAGGTSLKVFESTLSYDASQSPKTMFYTFPDAFESYYYVTALNFGTRPARPLAQVVSKLYNPSNGSVIDTWTTHYSAYSFDANGYLTGSNITGDLQQGMAAFYGKTYFSYQCQ
jgi:hypothetical protein